MQDFPEGEKYLGFENPSASICYANSAIQILYHSLPLRKALLDYKPVGGDPNRSNENAKEPEGGAGNGNNNFNPNAGEKDMLYELS